MISDRYGEYAQDHGSADPDEALDFIRDATRTCPIDIALAGGAMRFARTYKEVGAKAIVFDQECGPVEQASEELDDRATVPHPIGGLEDQAFVLGVVRHGTVDPGPQGRGEMNSRTFPAGSLTHIWPRSAPASTISRPCCFRRSRVFS